MHLFIDIVAVLLGVIGLLGSVLPVLPGPPLSWVGLLLLYFWGDGQMTVRLLVVWAVITLVVSVLDYIVPAYFTKVTGGSRAAERLSFVGMILGILFFPPWGMIIGAFLGAMAGEILYNSKDLRGSLKPALGSFLGFLFGTGLKLTTCGVMFYYIIVHL